MPRYRVHKPGYYLRRRYLVEPPKPDADVYIAKPKLTIKHLTKKPSS